jgi:hypothetical protein
MADLRAIREGLAGSLATLRANGTVGQVSPYLLANPTPPSLMVAAVDEYEFLGFGTSVRWTILVEACLGLAADVAAQELLNKLLAPTGATSVVAAAEADQRLTSRLDRSGFLHTGQAPAADSVAFAAYRGQSRFQLRNGFEVLLAVWAFEVISS